MRRICILSFLLLLLQAACQQEPTPSATAVPATKTAVATQFANSNKVTTAATPGIIYLPVVGDQPAATATATATPMPLQPTAIPTPAYPIYDGPPINRHDFGVQIHLHREDLDWLVDHLRALNVGWVKVQVSWKLYQPAPDQFATDRFAELDALVSAAEDNDIAVLLSVSKAPEWSRPITEMDGPPTDFALFDAFMGHLAARYQGRVAAYELWNEPNLQREWNGASLNPTDLVNLIRAGANGVRVADPAAFLISAAPATTGINDGVTAVDDRVFLQGMLAAGIADVVDGIGVHPYGWANPPDSNVHSPDTAVPSHNNHPSFFFYDTLHDYTAVLGDYGAADKPLWVTEFGWGSFDSFGAPPPTEAVFMANNTEWQQAEYLLRAYELAHDWQFVGPMMLWNLNFAPTLGNKFSESGYSLLRPDGSLRPAYQALQSIKR